MKDIKNRIIILSTIIILITMSIVPIQAGENNKDFLQKPMQKNSENILGYITVEWESFFATYNLFDIPPRYNFTQSDTKVFYFPEIDNVIKMNFKLDCKQKLLNRTLFPRLVRFDLIINHDNTRIFDEIKYAFCWGPEDLVWKNSDIIVGTDNALNDIVTNGSNATLKIKIGIRPFPSCLLFITGIYKDLEPITVVPIPR